MPYYNRALMVKEFKTDLESRKYIVFIISASVR